MDFGYILNNIGCVLAKKIKQACFSAFNFRYICNIRTVL